MRKLLLLLLLAFVGALWTTTDARWNIGERKNASQIAVGDTIVIEQASMATYLGYYIQTTTDDYGLQLASGTGLGSDGIIVVEEGPADIRTGEPTVYLHLLGTDSYIGTRTSSSNGAGTVTDIADAANFQILSCGEDIPWATTEAWGTSSSTNWRTTTKTGGRGSDDNSVGFCYSTSETAFRYLAFSSEPRVILSSTTNINQWNVYSASYEKSLQADLGDYINAYTSDADFLPGTDPGYYDPEKVQAYETELEAALIVSMTDGLSDEEYLSHIDFLKQAYYDVVNSLKGIDDGYYFIVSAYDDFLNNLGIEKAAYIDASVPNLKYRTFDDTNVDFVFYITNTDTEDEYYVQSYVNEYYVSKGTAWYNSNPAATATASVAQNMQLRFTGKWFWGSETYHQTSYTPYASGSPTASDTEGDLTSWGQWDDVCTTDNHSNLWYLRHITDDQMVEFAVLKAQANRDTELSELISEAEELYADLFAYTPDYDSPLITRASGGYNEDPADDNQITFSTIRYQGLTTSDKYEFLIDGDSVTYMQGSGYITIKLDEPVDVVTFTYVPRGGSEQQQTWGLNERPKLVNIYGANTEEGDTSYGSAIVQGTDMSDMEPHTINLGRAVNYIKYEVTSNYNNGTYFTLGEFQLYKAVPDESMSQYYLTEGMQTVADAMQAMATAKKDIVSAGTTTEEDIEEMSAAIEAVRALYGDTTALAELIAEAEDAIAKIEIGDAIGQVSDESLLTALQEAIDNARENGFSEPVVASNVQALTEALTTAYDNFMNAMNFVEAGKWYFITNLDETRTGDTGTSDAYCYGNALYPRSNSIHQSILRWGLYDRETQTLQADHNPAAMWTFESIEGTDYYSIRNLYTGYYLGDCIGYNINLPLSETPVPYELSFQGQGQFYLIPRGSGNPDGYAVYPWGPASVVVCHEIVSTTSAWTFQEVDPEEQEAITISDFYNNLIDVMALPYNVSNLADYNQGVQTYAIKKITQEENTDSTIVTTVELYEKNEFAAGEPCIVTLGNYTDDAETAPFEDYELIIPFPSETIDHNVSIVSNGIVGGLHSMSLDYVTAMSDGKQFAARDAGSSFAPQTGVIDVMTYTGEIPDVETALILTIEGLPAMSDSTEIPGDVNGDGEVTAADAVSVYNYVTNGEASGITGADVNSDGEVNSADAVTVYNYIVANSAAGSAKYKVTVAKP